MTEQQTPSARQEPAGGPQSAPDGSRDAGAGVRPGDGRTAGQADAPETCGPACSEQHTYTEGCALAAAETTCTSRCEGMTGIRGLLEHVGIDTTGRDITVAGRIVDPAPDAVTATCNRIEDALRVPSPSVGIHVEGQQQEAAAEERPVSRAVVTAEVDGELVCVDECGWCDACGMEPFGSPAEGWREAARFLRRTPRDSADFPGALRGARLIEAELRRMADEEQQEAAQ